jgi:hypothetical protein
MVVKRGPKPDMSAEERSRRDFRVMALFIAGNSETEIARAVNLTGRRVNQIIKRELKNAARHHELLTDQALAIYVMRLETLLQRVWPQVLKQDLKAIEVARRLLDQQARLYDLEEDRLPGLPPMSEQDLVDDNYGIDPRDELSKYRLRHRRRSDADVATP